MKRKFYRDFEGKIWEFEADGSQDHLIGNKVPMTATEVEAHINPPKTAEELLANAKEAQRNQIHQEFGVSSNSPVLVGTVSYHGGFDSVIKLDAVKRLSESLGMLDTTFYDVSNVQHHLSLVDAQNIITQIGAKFQHDFSVKQLRMVAVENATTIQEVEVV